MATKYVEQRDVLLLYWKELQMSNTKCNVVSLRSEIAEMKAYQLWAIEEAMELVEDNDDILPVHCVESLAKKLDRYSTYEGTKSWAYSVAYDALMDILGRMYATYN